MKKVIGLNFKKKHEEEVKKIKRQLKDFDLTGINSVFVNTWNQKILSLSKNKTFKKMYEEIKGKVFDEICIRDIDFYEIKSGKLIGRIT